MLTAMSLLKTIKTYYQDTNILMSKDHITLITTMNTTKNIQSSPFAKKRITRLKIKSLMFSPTYKINKSLHKSNTKTHIIGEEGNGINNCNSNKKKNKFLLKNVSNPPNKKEKSCLLLPLLKHNKQQYKPLQVTIRKTSSCGFIFENTNFQSKSNWKTQRGGFV